MIHEERTDLDGRGLDDLRAAYADALAAVIDREGVDAVAAETGLTADELEAAAAGGIDDLALDDAAAILALGDAPEPDVAVELGTEHLLLGMSIAVLDVESLAGEVELDASPKSIQQKLERRAPMSLGEFVALEHAIVSRRR